MRNMAACFKQSDFWKISHKFRRCITFRFQRCSCSKSAPRKHIRSMNLCAESPTLFLENEPSGSGHIYSLTVNNNNQLKTEPTKTDFHATDSKQAVTVNSLRSTFCASPNPYLSSSCRPKNPYLSSSCRPKNIYDVDLQDFFSCHEIACNAYKKWNYCDDDTILKNNYAVKKDTTYSLKFTNMADDKITAEDVCLLSCCTQINNSNNVLFQRSLSSLVSNLEKTDIQDDKNSNQEDLVPNEDKLQKICVNLSHHLPKLFTHAQDYSIYHRNIIFCNNITNSTKQGLRHYVMYLSKIKALGHLIYAHINMEIFKITSHPEDGTVRVRWRISVVTFWKLFSKFWKSGFSNSKSSEENFRSFIDGFSIFYVGKDGLIHKHICDKVMPDESYALSKPKKPAWMALIFSGFTTESPNSMKSSVLSTVNQNSSR